MSLYFICTLLPVATSVPPGSQCGDTPVEHFYLDRDLTDTNDFNALGDFDFCLSGTRNLIPHAFRPRLRNTQAWELIVRSASYAILGRAIYTLEDPWIRLVCHNGTYIQAEWGKVSRHYQPSEIGKGLWESYTDSMYYEHWTYGFYCTNQMATSTYQGICVRRFCCIWDLHTTSDWVGKAYLEGWLHPVGGGKTLEWDPEGPQRCGGIATDPMLLKSQDPVHPIGTAPRHVKLSEITPPPPARRLSTTNLSQCWICAHAPSHIDEGIPFISTPLTLDQYRSSYLLQRNLTFLKPSSQYIYLSGRTFGPVCKEFSGTGDHVGSSACNVTIKTDPEGLTTLVRNHSHTRSFKSLSDALTAVLTPFTREKPMPDLITAFRTGRIEKPLGGLFWICAQRAYTWVSIHMQGSCYLGHIHPGFRVTLALPDGRLRNRRSPIPTTRPQPKPNGETWLRALLPAYGTFSNHLDILRLADVLLQFMKESEATTRSVLTELTEVRKMSIQNRLCLDYLLSSQGGACKLIGTECCSFVSDQTLNITGHLDSIDSLTDTLKKIPHEGLSDWDPWSWLPQTSWLRELARGILIIFISLIVFLGLLCCCGQCIPILMSSFRSPLPHTPILAPLQPDHTLPEVLPMYHLGEGEYVAMDVRQ
ncbi:uncharacterized protein LOC144325877 [Podarcis muralis]